MNENIQDFTQQQQSVDYKALLFKFYRYWYLFAVTIFIALIIAFIFNKYTQPVFEVKTTVLIKDKSENKLNPQDLLGMGLFNNMQNLQNEIGVLSSYSLTYRTVTKIGFEVAYFSEDNFVTKELFKDCPFIVIMDTTYPQPVNTQFNVNFISGDKFRLEAKNQSAAYFIFSRRELLEGKKENISLDETFSVGQLIQTKDFKFKLLLTDKFDLKRDLNRSFSFTFNDYDDLVKRFKSFSIEPINKEASIVEIKLKGGNIDKLTTFLNALTKEYMAKGLERKNVVATRTISFIDNELQGITDSLNSSEKALMVFRTNKEIMNLDDEAKQVFEKMMQLQDEKAVLIVKSKYLLNMKDYIEKNQKLDELIVPASMGIDNTVLNDLTMQLTSLYMKRTEASQYSREKNPSLRAIDLQIATTKNALYENVKSAINSNEIAVKEINDRVTLINSRIGNLPETQRVLFGIERKFKLTDAIYTYLLQKRSEAQITQAANLSDNEVLDEARGEGLSPVFPKKSLNYIISLILGIILPIVYILGKDYFNDTMMEREDVEKITKLPIVGHIIHNDKPGKAVVIESPKSTIAESFRSVRTNINYLLKGKEKQTIMVTSDMVSAGKTFISINLASIFALYGKKTLLMGFDLRKPKIYQDFGLTNTEGISSYLINKSKLEDIIQFSGIENLDIIMAGPVPPNPAELIASDKCAELFTHLKEIYDLSFSTHLRSALLQMRFCW
ncbi:MAG: polysaccharide biosynthesis tyrosine autokinase [Bacteroidales bacterium]|nr:polysaccharide biosynthesis tyrosine autokinase [Bacteroidales bacterium]